MPSPALKVKEYAEEDIGSQHQIAESPIQKVNQAQFDVRATRSSHEIAWPTSKDEPAEEQLPMILIVDDDQFNLLALKHQTELLGYSCATAQNSMQAMLLIEERVDSNSMFRVIFMDYEMPLRNGVEVTQDILRNCE
jgi:PleD family two-component response regulator